MICDLDEALKNLFISFFVTLTNMHILQLSTATPKNAYSTDELMEIFPGKIPKSIKQNILNLGVLKRHLVDHANLSSKSEITLGEAELVNLCVHSCEKTIEKARLSTKNIGYFIATYDANPFLCPGLSQLLIRKLGFDPYIKYVNIQGMACSAFSKALELAENHLSLHPEDYVLLCISGVNSYWFYNQVRNIKDVMEVSQVNLIKNKEKRWMNLRKWIAVMECFLFGDGVASLIIAKDGGMLSVKRLVEVTNLREKDYLAGYARLAALNEPFQFGFHSHLDKEIPKLGVKYTSVAIEKLLGKNAENIMKTVKKWAFHTGSEKILNSIAEHHKIPHEKIKESYGVLREYGNLAGASLPFILEKTVSDNKLSKGDMILMLGYGWGFSASACLLEYMKQ